MQIDLNWRTCVFALASTLAACGGTDASAEGQDALSTTAPSTVTVRADTRPCAWPKCGGFYVSDANGASAERYVAKLDFQLSGFDSATIAKVSSAPAGDLVLTGKLGPMDKASKTRAFQVIDAYRGLPGKQARATDALVAVSDSSNGATCIASPCLTQAAQEVNLGVAQLFSSYSLDAAAGGFVDQTWLLSQLKHQRALAAGSLVQGAQQQSGPEIVLAADQIYLKLGQPAATCPTMPSKKCAIGEVMTFQRTSDRCALETGCVTLGICTDHQPACPAGYQLNQWRALPHGCQTSVCDPSFSL